MQIGVLDMDGIPVGNNTLADAILDRLMHNVHRINLKRESMRKIQLLRDRTKKATGKWRRSILFLLMPGKPNF